MIDTERLIRKAAAYGIDAAPVVRKLDEYAALLVEYNQKVNLTAITDAEGIEDRHFIDSLLLAARPCQHPPYARTPPGARPAAGCR